MGWWQSIFTCIEGETLASLAADYQPKAHKAANNLLEQLTAKGIKPETAEQANRRIQWQNWLVVISATLWELRTSLVYAEAHLRHQMERLNRADAIPTDPGLAFDYFIENATVRAHSVVEKTLSCSTWYHGSGWRR